jgi:hypothetical protein
MSPGFAGALRTCGVMLLCGSAVGESASPPPTTNWTGSFAARVEALAVLQTLNADLLSHDSATLTLERWCDGHRLASPPRIGALRVPGVDKPPTPEQRRELGITPTDPVRYRRVKLMCGALVLSEADNWYVPGRLTPEMNKLLDTTDSPFGVVVRALHFQRHTLSATLLWLPLPAGWEMNPNARDLIANEPMPSKLLEHRAVLTLPDGMPFSEVVETYTDNVLAFPIRP